MENLFFEYRSYRVIIKKKKNNGELFSERVNYRVGACLIFESTE